MTTTTSPTTSPTSSRGADRIWAPTTVGAMHLPTHLALAPMTRSRAHADGTPGDLASEYYAQRAGLGLLITEGTQPSADGQGYLNTPGIHTDAQVAGWRTVADAVHAAGAHLVVQLMHAGRMAHPDNTPHHRQPVAPSATAPRVGMHTATGRQDIPVPRALSTAEVRATVEDFARAAARAVEAGADAVEVHGANGYLVHQFLAPNANSRDDAYGGSLEDRARFALELTAAVAERIGPERVGVRLSPGAPLGGLDEGPEGPDLYRYLVGELDRMGLAYLHLFHFAGEDLLADLRRAWHSRLLLVRPRRSWEQMVADVESGLADVLPLGQWALANPDVVARLRTGAALTTSDPATFYGGGAAGYTDYPTLGAR